MTLTELETLNHELQEALNKLGMELLAKTPEGVELLTKKGMVEERINNGDYLPETTDEPIGVKKIDND